MLQKPSIAGGHVMDLTLYSFRCPPVVAAHHSIVRIEKGSGIHDPRPRSINRASTVSRSVGDVDRVKGAPYLVQKILCHFIEGLEEMRMSNESVVP